MDDEKFDLEMTIKNSQCPYIVQGCSHPGLREVQSCEYSSCPEIHGIIQNDIVMAYDATGTGRSMFTLDTIKKYVHLCVGCRHEFGSCNGEALYGTGHGNDNVWYCTGFK